MTRGLAFEERAHLYELDEQRVPSVTQTLKRAGLIDFSRIPSGILLAAQDRGRVVHRAVHYFNEHDLELDRFLFDFPSYAGYLQAWIAFTEQRHFVAVINERPVASRARRVAGTLDALCLVDDVPYLLDYATGRPDDVAKDLQTAAYHALAREWADDDHDLAQFFAQHPYVKRAAVSLRRDGTFRFHPYDDPGDWRKFCTLLEAQQIVAARRGTEEYEVAA